MRNKSLEIKIGNKIKYDEIVLRLHNFGYERVEKVSDFGQFSISGGLIKILSIANFDTIVIDFFGNFADKIYSINKKNIIVKKFQEISIPDNKIKSAEYSIKPSDLVVHINHGIGIFRGKIFKKINKEKKIFLAIEYANSDFLYLPTKGIEKISKYLGVSRRQPRLSRLGSIVWEKNKKRIEESIWVLAKELLEVYAKRELIKRPKYQIDYEWDGHLKKTFIHNETPDQETAIDDIYSDLGKGVPMDRLLIGDVGFGKTEVAVRAALQVVNSGFQVAILAPTTILSRQHFTTIKERLKDFPIEVAEISRLNKKNVQNEVVKNLKSKKIDLIIGTHRLLKSDVAFNNLGLVIIDEEQKFGVKDKEKFKSLKNDVDVLSLSATPIPRTLFIALSGIRQISAIKTPPKGRKSIETKVEKYEINKITEYISNELKRSGQIYFLHNDVRTIEARAKEIGSLFPKAQIGIAHGQLTEEKLVQTMADFVSKKIDILLCSTIIENGLDIPTANTLIVEDSDRFGLSQLYQIRGRIGRGENQAFALFTYKNKLSSLAFKRLEALTEHTELGSGFDIAFSDLEIRGGGNVLGHQQHGNMEELGLILYTKLLNQAVERLKTANRNQPNL